MCKKLELKIDVVKLEVRIETSFSGAKIDIVKLEVGSEEVEKLRTRI